MKKLFLLTLLLLTVRFSNAQNCFWDSTIVDVRHIDMEYRMDEHEYLDEIIVFHYEVDSGIIFDDSMNVIGFWSQVDTVFDPLGHLIEINTNTGSLTGWYVSSRIIRTYTPFDQLENETKQRWNGISWDTLEWRQRTYTALDQLSSETYWAIQSGSLINLRKVELGYANGVLSDKTTYHGAGNLWVADSLFSYIYTGLTRTNLSLSTWNVDSVRWDFVDTADYTMINGYWLSRIYLFNDYFITQPDIPRKLSYVDIDTSEVIAATYRFEVDTFTFSYLFSFYGTRYDYINGAWRLVSEGSDAGDPLAVGAEWNGSVWVYFSNETSYCYDSLGRLISEFGYVNSGSNGGGSYIKRWFFNSNGSLSSETIDFDGRVYNYTHNYDRYYYFGSDTVGAILLSDSYTPRQCPVSEDSSIVQIVLGCAPFHYQWLPSQGVVNDTMLYSPFTITDTATYTLVITDANGHSTELQVLVRTAPINYFNLGDGQFILSTLCNPNQNTLYTNYTWYYEGTPIASSTDCSIQDSRPGRYWCEITTIRGCVITTDTFVRQFQVLPSDLGLCAGGSLLLPDGSTVDTVGVYSVWSAASDTNFIATVNLLPLDTVYRTTEVCGAIADTTLQITHLVGSHGCDSLVITTLITHPESFNQIQVQFCDGDSLQLSDGRYVTQSGVYIVHLTGQYGCDSAQMVICNVQPSIITNQYINICSPVADTTVTVTTYTTTLGCDSTVFRNIISHPPLMEHIQVDLCQGDSLLLSNGTALSQTGNYSVLLSDQFGCDSTVVVDLTVHVPVVSSLVAQGNTLVATAQAASYNWYLNGVLLSITAQGTLAVQQSGYYEVEVVDLFNCVSDRVGINFITGMEDNSSTGFIAYPNPTHDVMMVYFGIVARRTIKLYDVNGHEVWSIIADSDRTVLQLQDVPAGIYEAIVKSDSSLHRFKVVKD